MSRIDEKVEQPEADWTVTQDRDESVTRSGGSWLIASARRFWRWLTSMRTALILLFLLALAAIPGSLLPQEKVSPVAVAQYYQAHPKLAPLVNDIGGFAVFASPWFSAIYLLLFISLIGCLVPRLRVYYQALRRVPPDAPSRLSRMPVTASEQLTLSPAEAAAVAKSVLRSRRYRAVIRPHDDGSVTVSAEKGYLKEAGNLLFHFSLMALLVGVAFGSWYGWHGDRLLVEGTSFCSTTPELSDYSLGERVGPGDLSPFCLTLDSFDASFNAAGDPLHFVANTSYTQGSSTASKSDPIAVNAPLRLNHANVYLVGHGYAPILKFTDKYGKSETLISPFLPLPDDPAETSTGVAVFPDLNINPKIGDPYDKTTYTKQQIGFEGVFLPTASGDLATSVYPGLRNPEVLLTPYIGDLGLDNGTAQNVYTLNQAVIDSGALTKFGMTDGRPISLKPGQSQKLTDGSTIEFVGTRQWAALAIRYDPGEKIVLVGALLLVLGLVGSLTGRRRRVWFRFTASGPSIKGEAGGLARAEYASFPDEFDAIVTAVMRSPAGSDASEGRNAHGKSVP
jgi:cytochrome c biogenesis protein